MNTNDLSINCYLIEPAENLISLLSKPITTYLYSNNDKYYQYLYKNMFV